MVGRSSSSQIVPFADICYRSRSTLCSAEITFKTDPKNTDYEAEHGASRNFENWREVEIVEEEDKLDALEESDSKFKALETRATDTKREMEILDALQDLRARNARHERVTGGDAANLALDARIEVLDEEELKMKHDEEEDDAIVRKYFSKVPDPSAGTSSVGSNTVPASSSSGSNPSNEIHDSSPPTGVPPPLSSTQPTITIKRKADFLEPDLSSIIAEAAKAAMPKAMPLAKKKKSTMASALGIKVKPKAKT
jgi:hypothetical protein